MTLNNPKKKEIEKLLDLKTQGCRAGLEVGGKKKTKHIQAAFYFSKAKKKSLAAMKKLFARGHFEQMKGTWEDQKYCIGFTKVDGKWVEGKEGFLEVLRDDGNGNEQGKRNDLMTLKTLVDAGGSVLDLYEKSFGSMVRYGRGITKYRALRQAKMPCLIESIEWYYGAAGSGKTHTVWEKYPDAYEVSAPRTEKGSPWYDLYQDEETLFFNDFRESWVSYEFLLKMCERVPGKKCLRLEEKGGVVCFPNLKRVVFTSVPPPSQALSKFDEQFARRVTVIEVKKTF